MNAVHFLTVKIPTLRGDLLIEGSTCNLEHGARIKVSPNHGRKHEREQDLGKLLDRKLIGKGIRAHPRVAPEHHTKLIEDMLPGMMHAALAIRSVLLHKTQRVMRKEARIRLAAVLHLAIHPADAGERVFQDGLVIGVTHTLATVAPTSAVLESK